MRGKGEAAAFSPRSRGDYPSLRGEPILRPVATIVRAFAAAAPAMVSALPQALAHPHVWVSVRATMDFDARGTVTAIKHEWTFDEGYTSFAIQGLDANGDGVVSRDELAGLAKENAESLAEFGHFTTLRIDGRKAEFAAPADYWMQVNAGKLTFFVTLPVRQPVASKKTIVLDVADPSFFVDFSYVEDASAMTLADAPKGCAAHITRPKKPETSGKLSEDYFANANMGLQFASKVIVACP